MKKINLRWAYTRFSYLITNTLVFLIVLTLAVRWLGIWDRLTLAGQPQNELQLTNLGTLTYGLDRLRLVYLGQSDEKIIWTILEAYNNHRFCLDREGMFSESPYRGHYVNIDAAGFRHSKDQAPWPPDPDRINIFLFGGSTTFGYGVADWDTIASYLQATLRDYYNQSKVAVYNFGRGLYRSNLEMHLYATLTSYHPTVAIFIDGLNDMARSGLIADREATWCNGPPPESDSVAAWLENRESIMAINPTIQTLFVIQPVPTVNYDSRYNVFAEEASEHIGISLLPHYYTDWLRRLPPDADNILDLSKSQEGRREPLYVDQVHYTANFNRILAGLIAEHLIQNGIIVH